MANIDAFLCDLNRLIDKAYIWKRLSFFLFHFLVKDRCSLGWRDIEVHQTFSKHLTIFLQTYLFKAKVYFQKSLMCTLITILSRCVMSSDNKTPLWTQGDKFIELSKCLMWYDVRTTFKRNQFTVVTFNNCLQVT